MTLTERTNAVLAKLREIAECKGTTPGKWEVGGQTLIYAHDYCIGNMVCHEQVAPDCPFLTAEEEAANARFVARSKTITPAMAKALIVAIEGHLTVAFIERDGPRGPKRDTSFCGGTAYDALESMLKTLEESP